MKQDEVMLGDLRPGAIFVTRDGIYAVKSEYRNDDGWQPQCVLLESGEYAYFPEGRKTLVREVLVESEEETSKQYTAIEAAIQLLTGMVLNLRTELLVIKAELVNLNDRLAEKEGEQPA